MTAADRPTDPDAPTTTAPIRHRRWSSISWRLAVLIIVLLAMSAVITAAYAASTVRDSEQRSSDESMKNVHLSVALSIEQLNADLEQYRTTQLTTRKQTLKDITNAQIEAMGQLDAAVKRGDMSLAAAQATASRMLYDYRYGSDDYFFAFTPDMVSIVEPNPTFRGNMLDYRDPDGKAFFREFQAVATGPGSGFVDYVGTRVGASEPAPKISYVSMFEPWQWVIGTGVYLDDIAAEAAARLDEATQQLSNALDEVEFSDNGFFLVLDRSGRVVAGADGDVATALGTEGGGQDLAGRLVAASPTEMGPIEQVSAAADLTGTSQQWDFGVSTVGSKGWVLVSAVPTADLTRDADRLAVRQLLLSLAVLVIGLVIGLLVSRRIVKPVREITTAAIALEEERFDESQLDSAAARRDEVGALARAFRRMAVEVVERERSLRERVARLQVVIDRRKVDDEISQITETDFFRRIEQQAEELRRRD